MNHEHETQAEINGNMIDITASYELDGYKPLIYGLFETADGSNDLTNFISEADYDRIYEEISLAVIENMTDAAEAAADMER